MTTLLLLPSCARGPLLHSNLHLQPRSPHCVTEPSTAAVAHTGTGRGCRRYSFTLANIGSFFLSSRSQNRIQGTSISLSPLTVTGVNALVASIIDPPIVFPPLAAFLFSVTFHMRHEGKPIATAARRYGAAALEGAFGATASAAAQISL